MPARDGTSFLRRVAFALVPLLVLSAAAELGLRAWFYQRGGGPPLAIAQLVGELQLARARRQAESAVSEAARRIVPDPDVEVEPARLSWQLHGQLYTEIGDALRARLQTEYAARLAGLADRVRREGSHLAILYLPSDGYDGSEAYRHETCRAFFRAQADRLAIDFIDASDAFHAWPSAVTTYLPADGHLSRFGHWLATGPLVAYLEGHRGLRASRALRGGPAVTGPQPPGLDELRLERPELPYRLVTNAQGFRMDHPLQTPKRRQRVLVIGDSFTFGPYVQGADTFVARADARLADVEVVNAGYSGTTIVDQEAYFVERGRFAEPDLVVLQVLDNDVYELTYWNRNLFAAHNAFLGHRQTEEIPPTELERAFVEAATRRLLGRPPP